MTTQAFVYVVPNNPDEIDEFDIKQLVGRSIIGLGGYDVYFQGFRSVPCGLYAHFLDHFCDKRQMFICYDPENVHEGRRKISLSIGAWGAYEDIILGLAEDLQDWGDVYFLLDEETEKWQKLESKALCGNS